jgi:large-conductance mechanosensitive channel
VITFLIIAAVVFFLVVRPYNTFRRRFLSQGDDDSVSDGGDGALAAVLVKQS